MAGDELIDDVNNATSSFRRCSMTFSYVCGFLRPKSTLYRTLGLQKLKHFVPSFIRPSVFDAYVVKCFALV